MSEVTTTTVTSALTWEVTTFVTAVLGLVLAVASLAWQVFTWRGSGEGSLSPIRETNYH